MGGRFLFELIPYRSSGLLRLFALGMAALLFLPHQVNKAVQHSRVTVQRITTANRIGVVVRNCLSPFLITVGIASIPILKLDGVGQDQHNPVQTIGLNHTFGGILVKVHPIKMFPHRRFNSLLALEIGPVGSPVLFQFSMLRRIGGSVRISRRCPQFLFGSAYIIGSVLNTIPHHIHVCSLQLFKIAVHIGQGRGRIQKGLRLGIRQLQFFHSHYNVLPDTVLIGVM